MRRDQPGRLVISPQPRPLRLRQLFAVDPDVIVGPDVDRRAGKDLTVDRDPALGDPALGVATRAQTRARDNLCDPLWLASCWRFRGGVCDGAGMHGDNDIGRAGGLGNRPVPSTMRRALDEAAAAAGEGEVPVGAVLVDAAGAVVAASGNRVERDRDPTAHAELLVVREGAARLELKRLEDCDLYVTLEPCPMCAAAIALARIRRLYFAAWDPKGGGVEHGPRIFDQPTCHHRPEVYGGIGERAASRLLRQFFRARR